MVSAYYGNFLAKKYCSSIWILRPNATSGFGIDRHKIKVSTYHVLLEELNIKEILSETSIQNLLIAPSNLDLTVQKLSLLEPWEENTG